MIRYFEITNPGNSGCSVQLIGRDRNFSVKKTSNSRAYDKRLRLQMAKQQQLFKTQLNGIIIPQVIRSGTNWYEMEYISMLDSISFFERSNPEMIKKRILLLIDFINSCIEQSPVKQLDKNVFLRKIGNIKRLAKKNVWQKYYARFEKKITELCQDDLAIPIGRCHGDLTFSNVLFSTEEEKICLIDFLDSFIESPLIDVIKLRQDTKFHWTSKRYTTKHDTAKIQIIDNWLDTLIVERYKKLLNSAGYKALEAMNYLRIVPYISLEKDHMFVDTALADVLKMK